MSLSLLFVVLAKPSAAVRRGRWWCGGAGLQEHTSDQTINVWAAPVSGLQFPPRLQSVTSVLVAPNLRNVQCPEYIGAAMEAGGWASVTPAAKLPPSSHKKEMLLRAAFLSASLDDEREERGMLLGLCQGPVLPADGCGFAAGRG